jgi:hypothetical protein
MEGAGGDGGRQRDEKSFVIVTSGVLVCLFVFSGALARQWRVQAATAGGSVTRTACA